MKPTPATTWPDVRDEARAVIADARHRLGIGDGVLETLVLASTELEFDPSIDTMQVGLTSNGVARVLANPGFVIDVGVSGTAFVLAHEAFHIVLGHLGSGANDRDRLARVAREVVVNHWVLRSGHPGLPTGRDGTPVGIDPRQVHADYAAALGETAVDYATFVASDVVCARELARVPDAGPDVACGHDGSPPTDARRVEDVLEGAVRRAADRDDRLRRQLLAIEAATSGSPVWGRVGVHELRGMATVLGATGFWRHHLRSVVGRLLRRRTEVAYDRKTGWWDAEVLGAVGLTLPDGTSMPLQPVRHADRQRRVAIYLDTSGSVPETVVDHVASTIGPIPDTEVVWHTFDHSVHPFEPGEALTGGGGTDFHVVSDHVDGLDQEPDAVLVLTDGFAPPVAPTRPARWVWLVLAGGDEWPADAGMTCVPVDLPTDSDHDPEGSS